MAKWQSMPPICHYKDNAYLCYALIAMATNIAAIFNIY